MLKIIKQIRNFVVSLFRQHEPLVMPRQLKRGFCGRWIVRNDRIISITTVEKLSDGRLLQSRITNGGWSNEFCQKDETADLQLKLIKRNRQSRIGAA